MRDCNSAHLAANTPMRAGEADGPNGSDRISASCATGLPRLAITIFSDAGAGCFDRISIPGEESARGDATTAASTGCETALGAASDEGILDNRSMARMTRHSGPRRRFARAAPTAAEANASVTDRPSAPEWAGGLACRAIAVIIAP